MYNPLAIQETHSLDYAAISPEELVAACLQSGDQLAFAEFVRRFHPLIARVVLRVARQWGETSPPAIDDLIQETYLKLCSNRMRVLQNFQSAHKDAIYGFMKVFTANLVHDHFKLTRSKKRGGGSAATSIDAEEPRSLPTDKRFAVDALERRLLIQEVGTCLQNAADGPNADRDRRIFWLYYRVGLSASEIAAIPRIELSTKGVESTLFRLTRQVRERLVNIGSNAPLAQTPNEKGNLRLESL
jgi:RNA polymerase sigma-70 factor (ECF subfamily)